jgi:hypothetical protein
MPSVLPRLTVVVTPEQHQLLARLGALQGRSQASYVRQLLDLATPSLRAILTPLERAEAEEEAMDETFQEVLNEQLREADEDLEEQLHLLDPLGIQEAADGAARADRSDSEDRTDRAGPPSLRVVR